MKLAAEPIVEDFPLANKTPAKLVITQFLKPPARRSLQLKACLKDPDSSSWIVSGWIVAGEESKLPTPDSVLAERMRSFLESFSLRSRDAR